MAGRRNNGKPGNGINLKTAVERQRRELIPALGKRSVARGKASLSLRGLKVRTMKRAERLNNTGFQPLRLNNRSVFLGRCPRRV